MERARTWRVERHRPVRADAPGIFVPVGDLDGAEVGDAVVVNAGDDGAERTGTIAEIMSGAGDDCFRIDLETQEAAIS